MIMNSKLMQFNNFDELINFLHGKDLSKLKFEIYDDDESCETCDINQNDEQSVNVSFVGFSDAPEETFEISNESYLLVDDYDYIPNACSSSKVSTFGRDLFLTICENSDGKVIVKMDVEINEQRFVGKEFILTTDKSIGNKINLNK